MGDLQLTPWARKWIPEGLTGSGRWRPIPLGSLVLPNWSPPDGVPLSKAAEALAVQCVGELMGHHCPHRCTAIYWSARDAEPVMFEVDITACAWTMPPA